MKTSCSTMECATISYPYFGWMDELRRYNEVNEWVAKKNLKKSMIVPIREFKFYTCQVFS